MQLGKYFHLAQKLRIWLIFRGISLEIHLSEHCNLNCASCSHYSPLAQPAFCDLEALKQQLAKLTKVYKSFRTIRLMGGEPLLNPEAPEVCRIVRHYFPDATIDLVTNGILFVDGAKKIPETFWEVCRSCSIRIAVTLYPLQRVHHAEIEALCRQQEVRFWIYGSRCSSNSFQRYQLDPNGNGSRSAYNYCYDAKCWQLVGNRIYACPQSAYVGYLNRAFGSNFAPRKGDYIETKRINRWRLWLFKLRTKPFCSYCVFPRPQFDWKQSERRADEWIL